MEKLIELKNKLENQYGQSALVMVLVVVTVMLIVITSVGILTYNDLKTIGNVVDSAQSYYTAESGVEDAVYRIVNAKTYSTSYSLTVGTGSTQVDVSGPLSALVVTSNGNINGNYRKLEVDLGTSQSATNVAFNYGVQIGYGGLVMGNNARVNGNVYSNGPISGANGAIVTGTAISASGAGSIDQANSSPLTPTSSITFGNANSSQDTAQSFQVSTTNQVKSVDLYLRKVGTPGNLSIKITDDSSGTPGSTVYASGTLSSSLVTGSYGWVTTNFTSNPQLTPGITYWLVIDGSTNSSNYYIWGANNTYLNGVAKTGIYSAGPWTNTNLDGYFRLYLGGIQNTLSGVTIGQAGIGDAWAHTVNNSTIAGTNYCQTGSGNNKVCNTSKGDPSPQAFPISAGNIASWKSEATNGGIFTGNYTPGGIASSLGPKEITGDLVISNNYTLTVTGTLWVHGNILIGTNSIVKLDPGYGANGGTVVADGWVNMSNNVSFSGSGQASSYFLLVTTSDCPVSPSCSGSYAMDISNNVGAVILYTTNGTLHLNNNAAANQATGYQVLLDNNAIITYSSGLANANFSSGPGGGFKINAWKEIE